MPKRTEPKQFVFLEYNPQELAATPDYTPEGERMPLVRASVREMRVAYLRCPSCGKESRVALDT